MNFALSRSQHIMYLSNQQGFFAYVLSQASCRQEVRAILSDEYILTREKNEVNTLGTFLQDVHRVENTTVNIPKILAPFPRCKMKNISILGGEVENVLTSLNVSTSAGCDGVDPKILKTLAGICKPNISNLFNASL